MQKPLLVLLAEDSTVNQRLATAMLERLGHSVTVASTGRQAVEFRLNQPFDLILMDVQMPEMDGLEAARTMRYQEAQTGGRIPIIAMTGQEMPGDRERCIEAGMDDYLAKPLRAQELSEKISQWTGIRGPTEPTQQSDKSAEQPEIDWSSALAAVGGKRALMRELIELFFEEGPRLLNEAQQSLERKDAEGLRIAAHTLKGSARYFGPNRVAELAGQVEDFASQNDLAAAAAGCQSLSAALADLLPVLHRFDGPDTASLQAP